MKQDCPRKHNVFIFFTGMEKHAAEVHVDILVVYL